MEAYMITNKRIITGILAVLLGCMPAAEANIFSDSYASFKNYLFSKETLKIAGTLTIGIIIGALITKLKWKTPQSMPQNNPQPAQQPPIKKADTAAQPNPGKQEQRLPAQNDGKQEIVFPISSNSKIEPIEIKKIESLVQSSTSGDCAFYALHNAQSVFDNFEKGKDIETTDNYLNQELFKLNLIAWKEETGNYREAIALKNELQQLLFKNVQCPRSRKHTKNDKPSELCLCMKYIGAFDNFGRGIAEIETENKKTFVLDKSFILDILRQQLRIKELIENFNTYFPGEFELKVTPQYLQDLVKKFIKDTTNEWLQSDEIEALIKYFPYEHRNKIDVLGSKNEIENHQLYNQYDPTKDYIRVHILGTMNENNVNSRGHWYCLAITKRRNEKAKAYIFDSLKHDLHTETEPEVLQLLAEQGLDASALTVEEIDRTKEPEVVALVQVYEKWFANPAN